MSPSDAAVEASYGAVGWSGNDDYDARDVVDDKSFRQVRRHIDAYARDFDGRNSIYQVLNDTIGGS